MQIAQVRLVLIILPQSHTFQVPCITRDSHSPDLLLVLTRLQEEISFLASSLGGCGKKLKGPHGQGSAIGWLLVGKMEQLAVHLASFQLTVNSHLTDALNSGRLRYNGHFSRHQLILLYFMYYEIPE